MPYTYLALSFSLECGEDLCQNSWRWCVISFRCVGLVIKSLIRCRLFCKIQWSKPHNFKLLHVVSLKILSTSRIIFTIWWVLVLNKNLNQNINTVQNFLMQWVWRHCRQATWGPSARWQTQRATEGCSVYMFLMFLCLDIIFSSFKKKFPCWIPRGSDLKTAHLGMRTPGHTPALSRINSDSLLQTSVQHREVSQEVSKLANISKTIKRKRD